MLTLTGSQTFILTCQYIPTIKLLYFTGLMTPAILMISELYKVRLLRGGVVIEENKRAAYG